MSLRKPNKFYYFFSESNHSFIAGEVLQHDRLIELCNNNLCSSSDIVSALSTASGPVLHKVEFCGDVETENGEYVFLFSKNVSVQLHEFALLCAERVLMREKELGRNPDGRLWDAIAAKRAWLKREMTDEQLAHVRNLAYDFVESINEDEDSIYVACAVYAANISGVHVSALTSADANITHAASHAAASAKNKDDCTTDDIFSIFKSTEDAEREWQKERLLELINVSVDG